MTIEAQDDKGLSIYWDYDAAQINLKAVSGYEVVRRIRSALHIFGTIQSFKMYHNSGNQSLSNLHSELGSSGVTLIDCHGPKEAATKMMIVDIVTYTWDHSAPRTIVVISGDKDLAYMIGTLRMRKHEVILISPKGTHPSLTNQASVNLEWTTDMNDLRGGQASPPPPSPHPPPSSHLPPSPHQFPSPSSPSVPIHATSGLFSHYPKTNFLSEVQEIDPPMIELQGMPTTRGRQTTPSHPHKPDRFDDFRDFVFSSPNVSNANGMFKVVDGRSQPQGGPARQIRSDSAPPGIYSTRPPVSAPDGNSFGKILSSKGKFPIMEPEDIGPQSPLTAKIPEEPRTVEGSFTSMHPSAKIPMTSLTTRVSTGSSLSSQDSTFSVIQFPPSSTLTSAEPINIYSNDTTERGKSPVIIAPQELPPKIPVVRETEKVSGPSLRKEETKDSPRAGSPIQPRVPNPFQPSPTPLPPSQKAPLSKNITPSAQAGPSLAPLKRTGPDVPPHFQVLVDTLRQHGGSHNKSSLPPLLLMRDPKIYKKAQVSKYTPYIEAAIKAGLVREVTRVDKGVCICLTENYA